VTFLHRYQVESTGALHGTDSNPAPDVTGSVAVCQLALVMQSGNVLHAQNGKGLVLYSQHECFHVLYPLYELNILGNVYGAGNL